MDNLLLDSTTQELIPRRPTYVASESRASAWGNPPISHMFFVRNHSILVGFADVYAYCTPPEELSTTPSLCEDLQAEMAAWEQLSDEALSLFELGLG